MAKLDRAAGDEAGAAGWEEKIKTVKSRQRTLVDPAVANLFSLPVPNLLNAIGSRMENDEAGLHAFWSSLPKPRGEEDARESRGELSN